MGADAVGCGRGRGRGGTLAGGESQGKGVGGEVEVEVLAVTGYADVECRSVPIPVSCRLPLLSRGPVGMLESPVLLWLFSGFRCRCGSVAALLRVEGAVSFFFLLLPWSDEGADPGGPANASAWREIMF